MATYGLIPGAGGDAWYWHLVEPKLRALGHDVVAVDLPAADDSAGLPEYVDAVVDAITKQHENDNELILVAQSMAGFTAPLVCQRLPVRLLVLVAAMAPKPGEAPGDWWANVGQPAAERALAEAEGRPTDGPFDPVAIFMHDIPAEVVAEMMKRGETVQSEAPFREPWPLDAWPDVPTRFLLCRQDRLFPAELQRRLVRERLGITPDEMDGGHLPALAHPDELTERLEAYRIGAGLS